MSEPLWLPDEKALRDSNIVAFARAAELQFGLELPDYKALWQWSTQRPADFWSAVWKYFDVRSDVPPTQVLTNTEMPGVTWFPGTRLNYVAQVFRDRSADEVAVTAVAEGGSVTQLSWGELEARVASVAATLRELGVQQGDRVVGYLPNTLAPLIGFLASASLGAIWSCCAPDYAAPAAATRLAQLEPVVMICGDGYTFGGLEHDRRAEAVRLAELMPALRHVLHVRTLGLDPLGFGVPVTEFAVAETAAHEPLETTPVPFDHPLWVLYSSGTTGVPKGLLHGHGGVVIEALKVYALHCDLGPGDRMFWYTSTNWMMWNFNASALLVGASIVVYDGSPATPATDRLWRIVAEHRVTYFGTSPGYLQACERQDVRVLQTGDLSALRFVGATGSPLPASSSYWVHRELDGRVPLISTSGGTDVVTALAYWAPIVATWPGEISCVALGVALDAFDEHGKPVRETVGELVVTAPMPTMPVSLWNDPAGVRYRETYFDTYAGVWRHGDWVTITERGSVIFHGRSDATLNRKGVRLGSADIYEIVEQVPGVRDSLVVGTDQPDGGYWMPLFVVLDDGVALDDAVRSAITSALRDQASPRHVPDEIIAVRAIPRTRTGKKLEVPIKRILLGAEPETVLSRSAVADASALDAFIDLAHERLA